MGTDKLDRTGTGSLFASSITEADMDAAARTLAQLAKRHGASAADLALTLGAIGYLDAGKALRASQRLAAPLAFRALRAFSARRLLSATRHSREPFLR